MVHDDGLKELDPWCEEEQLGLEVALGVLLALISMATFLFSEWSQQLSRLTTTLDECVRIRGVRYAGNDGNTCCLMRSPAVDRHPLVTPIGQLTEVAAMRVMGIMVEPGKLSTTTDHRYGCACAAFGSERNLFFEKQGADSCGCG